MRRSVHADGLGLVLWRSTDPRTSAGYSTNAAHGRALELCNANLAGFYTRPHQVLHKIASRNLQISYVRHTRPHFLSVRDASSFTGHKSRTLLGYLPNFADLEALYRVPPCVRGCHYS